MGSQDRIPENCIPFEDMWSLIKPEPSSEGFSSLLAGNGGQEVKDSVSKAPWDLPYVPVARSRSSLSNDSLQLCTEGLGCESCDCLTDSASSESSPMNLEDSSSEDGDFQEEEDFECEEEEDVEDMVKDEKIFTARSFPPPLPSLFASMRSVKKDGRFLLQSVKMPTQNFLQTFREGGRLKMQLVVVTVAEDESLLPSALIKPGNEILHEEGEGNEIFHEEGGGNEIVHDEGGSDSEVPDLEKCSESEDLPEAVSNPGGCDIQKQNVVVDCKFKESNNKSAAAAMKSVENHDINPSKPSLSADFNVYSGWRTEPNTSNLCHNWQKAQALPNYPVNNFKYAEANNVNLNVDVNESCVHARAPKFRLNDLGLGRCHAPKSLSVWVKPHCIATSS